MFKFLKKQKKQNIDSVIEKELEDNKGVLDSLKKHDKGEKEISTSRIERRFKNIQTSS